MLLRCVHLIVQAVKYIEPQIRLAAKAGKSKKEYKLSMLSESTMEKVTSMAEEPIKAVFTDPSYGKVLIFSLSFFLFIMWSESLMFYRFTLIIFMDFLSQLLPV